MSIQLGKPYKIIPIRHKRYGGHYQIPSEQALIVPLKVLGEEVSCDIRWENDNGELKVIHNAVFVTDNLMPLDQMLDEKLYGVWKHYYGMAYER